MKLLDVFSPPAMPEDEYLDPIYAKVARQKYFAGVFILLFIIAGVPLGSYWQAATSPVRKTKLETTVQWRTGDFEYVKYTVRGRDEILAKRRTFPFQLSVLGASNVSGRWVVVRLDYLRFFTSLKPEAGLIQTGMTAEVQALLGEGRRRLKN